MKRYSQIFIVCFLAILPFNTQAQQWSKSKARDWYAGKDWPVGCNFIPSTAINQLEMWQAESFDSVTIDRELGYAESIGFNTVRVFLHHLAWQEDAVGFKKRVDEYLTIANKHHIYTVFVFFDDCWNATYHTGKQPEPKIGVHNSGWVRDPGKLIYEEQDTLYPILESYVKDVLNTFKNDPRILMWDLYNEPGNSANGRRTLPLLKMVFKWAREVNPSQPVTAGVWTKALPALRSFQLKHSDVITYHNYFKAPMHASAIKAFKRLGSRLICTEYMARTMGSTFFTIMPLLKENKVGAINWGLVAGKTNTKYAWATPVPSGADPKVWFHDVFRKDGSAWDTTETNFIKRMTMQTSNATGLLPENFDTVLDGKTVKLFTLENKNGLKVAITNYGGRVVSLWVPDRNGKLADVVLGFNILDGYLNAKEKYFGALIGRYGNRISNGKFSLNGKEYTLATNNGVNHLHGGTKGFNAVVWNAKQLNGHTLELTYTSKDGEEGYPGNLKVKVVYTLTDENELKITYEATTDAPTVINLTHHSFFNLAGEGSGTINNHLLMINANNFTPVDSTLIPTGEVTDVGGTPFDFRAAKPIGRDLNNSDRQLEYGHGYDHNFVLNKTPVNAEGLWLAAKVVEPASGRVMEVYTNEPGMQFYGGNFLNGISIGKAGVPYTFRTAFCLETQHYPDSPNHSGFPSTVLNPGQVYHSTCVYKFGVEM